MTSELFETETMADLHARQGRVGEAIAIFRRLIDTHPGHAKRARWHQRIETLMSRLATEFPVPISPEEVPVPRSPGVVAVAGRMEDGRSEAIVTWALPPTPTPPALEVLLITRGSEGIETETRRIDLQASSGRMTIPADGLTAVAAAAGHVANGRFLALARSTAANATGSGGAPRV